ncbi:MAG: dephospho-CoA kinase [Acidimicrobiales bacterium]
MPQTRPVVLGLTGGMGVGKKHCGKRIRREGRGRRRRRHAIGRSILEPGGSAVESIVDRFGSAVRHAEGGIDRAALASIVFGHAEQLKRLTDISYPAINAELDRIVEPAQPAPPTWSFSTSPFWSRENWAKGSTTRFSSSRRHSRFASSV